MSKKRITHEKLVATEKAKWFWDRGYVALVAYVVRDPEYDIAELVVGFHTASTAIGVGNTFIHAELLRHISDLLQVPNDWERGYGRLPHLLTGTYRTIIGL